MPDGYAGRFALEAVFLILLAVGLGLADERPLVIVGVMAAGWLVVALVELLASRAARPPPPPLAEPGPVQELHGWDVADIVAPAAPEPEPEEAELTTVLPAPEEAPQRRRWLRRRA